MTDPTPAADASEPTTGELSRTTPSADDIPSAIPKDVENPESVWGEGDTQADIPAAIPKDTSDSTRDV